MLYGSMDARRDMIKNILLINPPRYEVWPEYFSERVAVAQKWAIAFQPAGLLRIGSYLRSEGHRVSMINAGGRIKFNEAAPSFVIGKRRAGNFNDKKVYSPLYHVGLSFEEFKKRLLLQAVPDEIYVTSFFTYQWEAVHEIIRICKAVFPSAKVILGGIYPTLCPDHAKMSRADIVYQGELIPSNHSRLALDLLEESPDYIILKTSRGCPGKCSYCAVHLLEGHAMRYREPEDVVDEIEEKIRDFNIKTVIMWESNILVNAESHLERMLDIIIRRNLGLKLSFPEGFNPFLLNEALLHKMKRAGLTHMSLSVETTDKDTALRRFGSSYKFDVFTEKMKFVKKVGIPSTAFVMAGMPNQAVEDVRRSILDVLHSGCRVSLMPFTPIPGTKEYEVCYQNIAHKGLEELYPMLWPCVKSSVDYERLCRLHEKCIRLHPIK